MSFDRLPTMKIAVLGGGITGLTAAYYLVKEGHTVTIIEKAQTLGGLAQGFREPEWDWALEYAYHHIFASDTDIQKFAEEIGFDKIYFSIPRTNSVYENKGKYQIYPVDSPLDFLQFPLLSMLEKIRAAFVLALLKFLPHLSYYESISSERFVKRYMGENMWKVFFEQLFRKKFGKYAGKVTASFLWARIYKRTQSLGYIKGGFQEFTDYVERKVIDMGVGIQKGKEISSLKRKGSGFEINTEKFDKVVSTLPTHVLTQVAKQLFPEAYLTKLSKLSYLHALVLIIESDKPFLKETYWLNICTPKIPAMVIAQHTNFVSPTHYGGKHIAYVGYYLERDDPLMSESKENLLKMIVPHMKSIEGSDAKVERTYLFKGAFAQPIFDAAFKKNKPDFITPVENLYIANLDMTYPFDRGTNYAVSLGRRVAEIIR